MNAPPLAPHLPYGELDALLTRVEQAAAADPAQTPFLVRSIAGEVRRLRALVQQETTAALDAGTWTARRLVAEVHQQAEEIRRSAEAVRRRRVAEADEHTACLREAVLVALRVGDPEGAGA